MILWFLLVANNGYNVMYVCMYICQENEIGMEESLNILRKYENVVKAVNNKFHRAKDGTVK